MFVNQDIAGSGRPLARLWAANAAHAAVFRANAFWSARRAAEAAVNAMIWEANRKTRNDHNELSARTIICDLLRHIAGNPFRSYRRVWPFTVVQLAESLYDGQDFVFALHDALLEAGHTELAEHFREEKSHPKGCWVVDMILSKE
jgi:hypothetical protein